MESECLCPACLQIFTDTALLPCGHTFCLACVSKTETLAQSTKEKPLCFVCCAEYSSATKETPHPKSEYHEKVVKLRETLKKQDCFMCDNSAILFCESGCGLLCEDCHETHHSKMKHTKEHKVSNILNTSVNHWMDFSKCILHGMTIVSVSQAQVPGTSEMCDRCECLDLKKIESAHEYFKLRGAKCTRNSTMIEADHLIAQAEGKIRELSQVLDIVTERMKEIDNVETELNAKIDTLYESLVAKAAYIRNALKSFVYSGLLPRKNTLKRTHNKVEAFKNVHRHSMTLLQESKELFQVRGIQSKILKSIYETRSLLESHEKHEINVENCTTEIRNGIIAKLKSLNPSYIQQFTYVGTSWSLTLN